MSATNGAPVPPRHPSRAPATSPAALEWKKRADRWLGGPFVGVWRIARAGRPPAPPPEDARHVVLCKLWGIGNLAMVVPLVAAVRARHPRARVTFVTLERNHALLASQPGIDRILTLRDHGLLAPLADLAHARNVLRDDRADLFLDFEQFLRVAGLLARASQARCVVGFDTPGQARAGLYDRTVPLRSDRHMALGFAELVRAAGIPTDGVATHALALSAEAEARIDRLLAARGAAALPRPWTTLHPGSGDNFPGRRWPVERFAATAARLHARRGGTFFVTGGAGERALAAALAAELAAHAVPAVDLANALDAPTLLAWIARCDLVLANDTGPVHLASAVATPVVALFGPNSPQIYGPLGPRQRALYHAPPCSPCLTNQNAKTSSCTLPICILRIDVEEAVAAAEALLAVAPSVVRRDTAALRGTVAS